MQENFCPYLSLLHCLFTGSNLGKHWFLVGGSTSANGPAGINFRSHETDVWRFFFFSSSIYLFINAFLGNSLKHWARFLLSKWTDFPFHRFQVCHYPAHYDGLYGAGLNVKTHPLNFPFILESLPGIPCLLAYVISRDADYKISIWIS